MAIVRCVTVCVALLACLAAAHGLRPKRLRSPYSVHKCCLETADQLCCAQLLDSQAQAADDYYEDAMFLRVGVPSRAEYEQPEAYELQVASEPEQPLHRLPHWKARMQ